MKKTAKKNRTKRPVAARKGRTPLSPAEKAAQVVALREADALDVRLRETVKLEAGRSGETGRKARRMPDAGPVTLRSRDGLSTLLATASITEAEAQAGLAFRHCFEAATTGLRSSMAEPTGGSSLADVRNPAALRRAYLMSRLNQMERAVGDAMVDGRELLILRLVAGEGRTIRSIAGGDNAGRDIKAAYLAALRRALAAVASTIDRGGLANQPR